MHSRVSITFMVVTALILGGALLQPFGGDAAARPNGEGNLVGTWRVNVNPINAL